MAGSLVTSIPYGRQSISEDDVAAVAAALASDYLTTGPLVAEYERKFARAVGAEHAVASNSGTSALHLAALALGLGSGDAAVVPTMTFLATANAVQMTGADVVFADVDANSGLMTSASLEAALARAKGGPAKVKAAFPVHLNGQLCDMEGLASVAAHEGIELVEDACHALGAADAGACRKSFTACFSTHPVKAITTGEGGVTTTRCADTASRMRSLRSHGIVREAESWRSRERGFDGNEANAWYYEMHNLGWNYRLPDIMCALGLSQLTKLRAFHDRRLELSQLYDTLIAPLAPTIRPAQKTGAPHGWHLYAVAIDFAAIGASRTAFMKRLAASGVGSQVHYPPVHTQPYYLERYGQLELPGAESYYARCLSIPLYPALGDSDVRRVVNALANLAELSSSS